MDNLLTFSGHLDTEEPKPVKKIIFDSVGASKVGVPCLTMANYPWPQFDWIKTWDPHLPDSNCVKFQIFWLLCISLQPNDQKKIEFDLQAFTRIQNHPIESNMMRDFSEKGHFWKWFWLFWSQVKSDVYVFDFSGHLDTGLL